MYQPVPGTAGARKLGWDKARFFLWETDCRKGFPLESSRECALPTLWPQPPRLHNCDRTCFCCWSHPTCGNGSYRELIQCAGPQEDSSSSKLLGWIDEHLNYVAAFHVPCVTSVSPVSSQNPSQSTSHGAGRRSHVCLRFSCEKSFLVFLMEICGFFLNPESWEKSVENHENGRKSYMSPGRIKAYNPYTYLSALMESTKIRLKAWARNDKVWNWGLRRIV